MNDRFDMNQLREDLLYCISRYQDGCQEKEARFHIIKAMASQFQLMHVSTRESKEEFVERIKMKLSNEKGGK